MPSNINPAFQRRQEEQRQRDRQLAANRQAESVRRARGGTAAPSPAYIAAADAAYEQVQHHRNLPGRSIIDQVRPMSNAYNSMLLYGESITHVSGTGQVRNVNPRSEEAAMVFHNPVHYTAGMDPVDLNSPGSGGSSFTLLTGPRGYAELTHAIQERITQERARPATTYDMAGIVERYGHLLTAADQHRLGYVLPTASNSISPMQFYKQHWKTEKPVANFLASPPGPTAQELAAADEWLKNSPWG